MSTYFRFNEKLQDIELTIGYAIHISTDDRYWTDISFFFTCGNSLALKSQTTKQVKFISRTNEFSNWIFNSTENIFNGSSAIRPVRFIFIKNWIFSFQAARKKKYWKEFGFVYIESKPHLIETKTNRRKSFTENTWINTVQRRWTLFSRK